MGIMSSPPPATPCAFLIAPKAQAAQKCILLLLPLTAPHRYRALRTSARALRDNLRCGFWGPRPKAGRSGGPPPLLAPPRRLTRRPSSGLGARESGSRFAAGVSYCANAQLLTRETTNYNCNLYKKLLI